MAEFVSLCIDRNLELAGDGVHLKKVATPFMAEEQETGQAAARKPCADGAGITCPSCGHVFPVGQNGGSPWQRMASLKSKRTRLRMRGRK